MIIRHILPAVLCLFDGAAAGAAGDGAANGGEAAAEAAPQQVRYGTQPETSGEVKEDKPAESEADRRKRYTDAIRGEFKDFYTEDTQRMLDKRFKDAKKTEDRLAKYVAFAERFAPKYGADASDIDALTKAVDDDDDMWREAAENEGMTLEAYKRLTEMERRNKALEEAENRRRGEAAAQATLAKWSEEESALQAKLPGFSLRDEAQNPTFVSLLRAFTDNGFPNPVEMAYKNAHMDEIATGAVRQAQAVTEQRVTANIRARGQRPTEAGLGASSGVVVKNDVTKLTKQDRAEIARRAMRGERISFS